jgi:hypothetical protein
VVDARLLEDSLVPKWSPEVVVERLRARGAGLRMALAFVEAHLDLLSVDAVRSALDDIANDAVQGALGIETIFSLTPCSATRSCGGAWRRWTTISSGSSIRWRSHCPARCSGRFPSPAGQAALVVYQLSAGQRAHQLLHLLETTRTVRPESVRMWASALRDLPVGRPGPDEPALRERLRAVTGHVLGLLPSPTGSTPPSGEAGRARTFGRDAKGRSPEEADGHRSPVSGMGTHGWPAGSSIKIPSCASG